jgi:hypothetical protein
MLFDTYQTSYIFSPTLLAKKVSKKQVWLCGTSFYTKCFVKDFLCFKHFFDTKLDPSNDLQVWYPFKTGWKTFYGLKLTLPNNTVLFFRRLLISKKTKIKINELGIPQSAQPVAND